MSLRVKRAHASVAVYMWAQLLLGWKRLFEIAVKKNKRTKTQSIVALIVGRFPYCVFCPLCGFSRVFALFSCGPIVYSCVLLQILERRAIFIAHAESLLRGVSFRKIE